MSFNKSFNLNQFINDIPSIAIRKGAWLSMVGSVNANLVAQADGIARKLMDAGYSDETLREVTPREMIALMAGPETGPGKDAIAAARKLYRLHSEFRTELLHATVVSTGRKADADLGSLSATISMMTGPQKERDINREALPMLAELGIQVTPAQIAAAKAQRLATDNQFANIRRQRAGLIEFVIDRVFATDDRKGDAYKLRDTEDNVYATLDEDTQEFLANKLMAALNKMLTTCINNVLFGVKGDDKLGAGDHLIISKLLPQLIEQMVAPKPGMVKRVRNNKKAKPTPAPKLQRSTVKPVQSQTVTETLPNGIKLTHAVTQ